LLSVLSCLAENPARIKNLFVDDEVNEQGIFAIKMFKNGI